MSTWLTLASKAIKLLSPAKLNASTPKPKLFNSFLVG